MHNTILIGFLIASSIMIGMWAKNEGRSFIGWFILSALISPVIAAIALAIAGKKNKAKLGNGNKLYMILILVAGMAMTTQAQTQDQLEMRKVYALVVEASMKDYEPVFYADVTFTRYTMVLEITSDLDTHTKAKDMWEAMVETWDYETKKEICDAAGIIYLKIIVDDKYNRTSFKDKIQKPRDMY